MSLVLTYLAGPFTAPTRAGVEANIRAAVDVAVDVAELGAVPICSQAMTADPRFEGVRDYAWWIAATSELLRRCDACLMVPGWESSNGARGERTLASQMRLPTFDTFVEFRDWFRARGSVRPGREALKNG